MKDLIKDEKALYPDRFTSSFCMHNWNLIKMEMMHFITKVFDGRESLEFINQTSISLIPMVTRASCLSNFRLISCLNTIYKIVSKLLAVRIARVLPK